MSGFRSTSGGVLLVIGLAALVRFESFKDLFLFLSPDRDVSPYLWTMLRVCLMSLGAIGAILLFWRHLLGAAARLDRYLVTMDRCALIVRLLTLAFLLRALILWLMPFRLWSDYRCYHDLAAQWATDGGYYSGSHLTAYWPPGYPFFLSRLYLIFGQAPLLGAIANLLLGTAMVWLSYLLIRRLWGERIGRWAFLTLALFPSQILFTNLLASEMLFTLLFLGAIILFVDAARPGRWIICALTGGMILGLATLARTITTFYLVPVVVFWAVDLRRWKPVLGRLAVALAGFALIVTPWMIRNQSAVGRFCLSTNSGVNLFIGNQPGSGMGYNQDAAGYYDLGDPTKEAAIDSAASAQAWEYIKDRPLSFLGRGLMKVGFLYATDLDPLEIQLSDPPETPGRNWWLAAATFVQAFWLGTLFLALGGTWVVLRSRVHRDSGTWLLLGTIAYWTGVHFIFFAAGRFHFPLVPLIAALAAVFLAYRIDLSPASQKLPAPGTK